MKIQEAIIQCDDLKPNQYSQLDKIRWLNDVESQIKAEIIDTHKNSEEIDFNGYDENTDHNTELIAKAPYSDLYVKYLMSQIDFTNGEFDRYNNSALMFNVAYQSFANNYNKNNMPLNKGKFSV